YLQVTRSETDFDGEVAPDDIRAADAAALRQLIELGAYDDSDPAIYVYRLRDSTTEHTGLVVEVAVEAFESGQVRGHESVQDPRVEALVRHFGVVPARSELVALLHRGGQLVDAAIATVRQTQPLLQFWGDDGIEQTVWRIDDDALVATLSAELSSDTHYIADGHHRVAASLQEWQAAGRPRDAGVLCVMYPPDQLNLTAFHRRVAGPVDSPGLLAALREREFVVKKATLLTADAGCFGLYVAGNWYVVSSDQGRPAGVAGVDVSLLHERVLEPVFGIDHVGHPRLDVAPPRTPVAELAARCDVDAGALFVLRPPTIDQLVEVADRGEVMMPKTTYFQPKPQAGIFLRFGADRTRA
ncbi:MAG: DUF1015 family protein, partial [Nocardioidaceae bacterium]